jgi:hypothetical protein
MPYFRINYDGYIEGEYKTAEEAITDAINIFLEDIENEKHLNIEEYDEDSEKWI